MKFDAIIIGAGIIGCTCAGFLARAGLRVAVLDSGTIAEGTTANSFSWANASTKINDPAYHQFNAIGVATYHSLANEYGAKIIGANPTGALFTVSKSDFDGAKDLKMREKALTSFGYPSEHLDTNALQKAEPNLTIPDGTSALLTPHDLVIDGPKFSRFMLGLVSGADGSITENIGPLSLIANDDGVVSGLQTPNGSLSAPNVIVATGQHTAQTLAMITGYDGFATGFPLQRAPGLLLTTPPLPINSLPHHVLGTSTSHEVHFLPAPNGGLKIGSDDVDGMIIEDQSPENMAAVGQQLLNRAQSWIPSLAQLNISDCHLGIGVRPYPKDGKSIIGPMPESQGLFVLATHSGISLAPAIGKYMVDIITNTHPSFDARIFSLSRFGGFQ